MRNWLQFLQVALLACIFLFHGRTFGWNDTGHEVIACMAYDELTPATRSAVDELLKQHPRYEQDLLAGLPKGFDPGRYAFMIAATWPDMVRSQTNPMHFVANHPTWHYIDIPYYLPGYEKPATRTPPAAPTTNAAASTQPTGPKDVLEALDRVTADLHDTTLTPADRAIALCWTAHLIGDLHQPLHAAEMFSERFPDGDRGGNAQLVLSTPFQSYSQINVHALWDQMLGTYRSPEMIVRLAKCLAVDPQFTRERLAATLAETEFAAWAKESHDLAVTDVYLNGKLETASQSDIRSDGHRSKIPAVPPDYISHGEEVSARRAMLAEYRMADVLNRLLNPVAQSPKH